MKLFTPAVLAAAAALAIQVPSAHAQFGVYGTVTAQHLSGLNYSTVGYGSVDTLTSHTGGVINPIGGTGGIFYDFRDFGPVRLGVDARGSLTHTNHGADPSNAGSGGRLYLAMGGLRATLPNALPRRYSILAPYAQVDFGYARTDGGTGSSTITVAGPTNPSTVTFTNGQVAIQGGFAYQGLLGLDIHALPAMDVRLFEVGIGGVSGIENQPGTHLLESVSVGVVFHLPY